MATDELQPTKRHTDEGISRRTESAEPLSATAHRWPRTDDEIVGPNYTERTEKKL